ncbi:cytochrome P450 [Streptomyces yerevanensis]|uniref:cytochrome P450 n=1 Tax=Streptomyces yerevanensis TaxID=66378 RepID=UPI001B80C1C2|nr:cytochrome P450 [Streptomyces yerevanensis]
MTLPFGGQAWLVTRHDDVRSILSDGRFSRASSIGPDSPRFFAQPVAEGLGYLDPPEHTRLRALLNRSFTPHRVEKFRPRIQELVDELLERAPAGAGAVVDLTTEFAQPLAGQVVCEFTGVPYTDRGRFEPLFAAVVSTTAYPPEEIAAAVEGVKSYFIELVAREREAPTESFFGALVRQNDAAGSLSDEALANLGFGVVIAGYETTSSQLCNFVYLLLTHPDQLAGLRADPEGVPRAVEELLRFTPLLSYGGNPVVATEDVEIAGQLIRAGETVVPSNNAANRDERVFTAPDQLDLSRDHNPHLTFHHGPHYCLGAQLARAELQIALEALITRRPRMELAVPADEMAWATGSVMRKAATLPVRW